MLIPTFGPPPWQLPAIAAAEVRCLNTMSNTEGQEKVTTSSIPRLIHWAGHFFIGRYSDGDRDVSIKADVTVMPSGTLLTFYRPLRLILSSHVSTAAILVVLHICFHPYSRSPLSSHISFFVPMVSSLYLIYAADVSITPRLHLCIRYHTYPMSLSYRVSDDTIMINLILPFVFYLLSSTSSCISASSILVILHLCRVSYNAVSIDTRLLHLRLHNTPYILIL